MLNKIKKSNSEGFTIIEVMIVLAVAALILLIVLLAVPALQRNSRNTALKNDASTVAGGISTSESDNNGTTPTGVTNCASGTATSGSVTVANTTSENISVQGNTCVYESTAISASSPAQLSNIGGASNPIVVGSPTITTGASSTLKINTGQIMVVANASCWGSGSTTPSTRAFAIMYLEETSGSPIAQCIDS